jgi:hypothetical protein
MDELQAELSKHEFKDNILFDNTTLDADAVADFYIMLDSLFEKCFKRISSNIETLSGNEILKFISLKKREFKEIWDMQTEYGRLYGFNMPLVSVADRMQQFGFDEAIAIQHREKSEYSNKIYETKMVFILKSLIELMKLYRKYTFDLLTELKRFDFEENIEYNDIPLIVEGILSEPSVYSEWIDRLFDKFFETLLHKINTEGDLKLIDINIQTFKQIKKELSEKGEYLANASDSLEIFCCKKLYEQQHQYIDKVLTKLKELQSIYLPNSTVSEVQIQSQSQPQPQQSKTKRAEEKSFADYLHHPNKDALMKKLHELFRNAKGKKVALLIKSLEELHYLAGYNSKNELYASIKAEFGDFGSIQSVNDFLNPNNGKIQEKDLATYLKILEKI